MREEQVKEIIHGAVSETVQELKKQGLIRDGAKTPFQKTEQVLYNYNSFKTVVAEKQKTIEDVRRNGLPKKSKSITSFSGGDGLRDVKMEDEMVDDYVAELEKSVAVTAGFINIIDDALDKMRGDAYYQIIPMKYFELKTYEEIAVYYGKDVSTISRNRNRLINELKIKLFCDEVIREIFRT